MHVVASPARSPHRAAVSRPRVRSIRPHENSPLDRAWRDLIREMERLAPALAQVLREERAAGVTFNRAVNQLMSCFRADHFKKAFDAATNSGGRLSTKQIDEMRDAAHERFPVFDRQWPGGPREGNSAKRRAAGRH